MTEGSKNRLIKKIVNINQILEKHPGKVLICGLSVILGAAAHLGRPTRFPHLYYTLTDPFITTATEQRIEERFGIDYEGTSDEKMQKYLEETLQNIYKTNPSLLVHAAKIILHSKAVLNSPFVEPFIDNRRGQAVYPEIIELMDETDLRTVVHELTHIADFHAPKEFDRELNSIFGSSYKGGIFKRVTTWDDGSVGPKDGFIRPYGASNSLENVATYVEKAYTADSFFWEDQELQQSDKYLQTFSLLAKYGFLTPKQFEEIKKMLEVNNPKYVSDMLAEAITKVEPPKCIRQEVGSHYSMSFLYENPPLHIAYAANVGNRESISVILQLSEPQEYQVKYGKTFNFIKNNAGNLEFDPRNKKQHVYEAAVQNLDMVAQRLTELGYDKLFDWNEIMWGWCNPYKNLYK